jgi:hypothetical protein
VTHEQEQRKGDAPESNKLGVGAGHAIAFAMYTTRSFFLDETLQSKVEDFAGELTQEHEGNFDLAGEEHECSIDDAERLGEESEVGAYEREVIFGVLWDLC